jgi:hypothetical protein
MINIRKVIFDVGEVDSDGWSGADFYFEYDSDSKFRKSEIRIFLMELIEAMVEYRRIYEISPNNRYYSI